MRPTAVRNQPQSKEEYGDLIDRERRKLTHLKLLPKPPPCLRDTVTPEEEHPRLCVRSIYRGGGYAPEVISVVTALLWGSWVGNPYFSVYAQGGVIYSGPESFGPEELWGGFVFVSGALALFGLLQSHRWARSLGTAMLVSVWSWGFIAAVSGPSLWTTAPVAYPVLAWVAAWAHSLLGDQLT